MKITGKNDHKPLHTTFPVASGLLEAKHVRGMGSSIWCFLWCIDRTTRDRQEETNCWGQVLGGASIQVERIAGELGLAERTVRSQLSHLQAGGYIRLTRCSYGQRIEVARSIKWRYARSRSKRPDPAPPILPEPPRTLNSTSVRPFFGSLADELRKRLQEREQAEQLAVKANKENEAYEDHAGPRP